MGSGDTVKSSRQRIGTAESVPSLRIATALSHAFGDHGKESLAAWKRTVGNDLASGRCCRRRSLLMLDGDEIVAAGLLYGGDSVQRWRLGAFGVASSKRRLGLGRMLIDAIAGRLSASKASEVACEVRASNTTAQRFFSSCGFTTESRLFDYLIRFADLRESASGAVERVVIAKSWESVSHYFSGGIGIRSPHIVSSHAKEAGTLLLHLPGQGAAVLRGRWLIDVACLIPSTAVFETLLCAAAGRVDRLTLRHVPEGSQLSRYIEPLGLETIDISWSLVRAVT
ncbi:MAG: N-acetyltransferase [Myxococcota bacterium]|nr:N-acetyltransferase [Myxococcota bacterium]